MNDKSIQPRCGCYYFGVCWPRISSGVIIVEPLQGSFFCGHINKLLFDPNWVSVNIEKRISDLLRMFNGSIVLDSIFKDSNT